MRKDWRAADDRWRAVAPVDSMARRSGGLQVKERPETWACRGERWTGG